MLWRERKSCSTEEYTLVMDISWVCRMVYPCVAPYKREYSHWRRHLNVMPAYEQTVQFFVTPVDNFNIFCHYCVVINAGGNAFNNMVLDFMISICLYCVSAHTHSKAMWIDPAWCQYTPYRSVLWRPRHYVCSCMVPQCGKISRGEYLLNTTWDGRGTISWYKICGEKSSL